MNTDLNAATGIITTCLVGALIWFSLFVAYKAWSYEHIPYEPAEKEWYSPYRPEAPRECGGTGVINCQEQVTK